VLRRREELVVLDNLARKGAEENLAWLRTQGEFELRRADVARYDAVEAAVRERPPDVLFHLAGQVAMTTSIANPRLDFETNVVGGHNVLEAVRRHAPGAVVTYSSTNKVYGDLETLDYEEAPTRYRAAGFPAGFDERLPLDFRSPYGCSKGATDQYMLDYARVFGLRTVVFRHSSIFGGRQFSTVDQGWVGWFVAKALEAKAAGGRTPEPFTISGNGKQVRDVLFASDLVALYFAAVRAIDAARGQAFNIGGGMEQSLSLLELFAFLERELDVRLSWRELPWRQSDQKVFVADIAKARRLLGWAPAVARDEGIRRMIEWVRAQ
jgi:CDP-paratose 2-epimerase